MYLIGLNFNYFSIHSDDVEGNGRVEEGACGMHRGKRNLLGVLTDVHVNNQYLF